MKTKPRPAPDSNRMTLKSLITRSLELPPEWSVKAIEWESHQKVIQIHLAPSRKARWKCSVCNQVAPIYDTLAKTWRHLDLWTIPTWLHADVPRTKCPVDGVHAIQAPWADARSRMTRPLTSHALRLLRHQPVGAVANILGLSWDQAKRLRGRNKD